MRNDKKSEDIAVYIIDNHVLMRQILVSMFKNMDGVQLKGSAHSILNEEFERRINQHKPDVVFLGVDHLKSPEMDLFHYLRAHYPTIPVVLMSPLSRQGAKVAITGLKYGAVDYITKPDCKQGLMLAGRHFRKRVPPILSGISIINKKRVNQHLFHEKYSTRDSAVTSGSYLISSESIDVLTIGGCMGGVHSLFRVISKLPEKFPIPVVIVQHMPKIYTQELAAQLDPVSPLNVREAKDGSPLLPGQVYIAPGGSHIVMKNDDSRKKLFIHRGPREHKSRPSMDVLLRSAVQVYGDRVLSLFLSGGGNDGVYGAQLVRNAGGDVIIESRESALVWENPQKIWNSMSGVKDFDAEKLVPEILKRIYATKKKYASRFEFENVETQTFYLDNGFQEK